MVMEWEAESEEASTTLAADDRQEQGAPVEASEDDLIAAVGRARRARLEAANVTTIANDEVIFEPSF